MSGSKPEGREAENARGGASASSPAPLLALVQRIYVSSGLPKPEYLCDISGEDLFRGDYYVWTHSRSLASVWEWGHAEYLARKFGGHTVVLGREEKEKRRLA